MKHFWNILVLAIFVNFISLPTVAVVCGFDLPQTNIIIPEEENHSSSLLVLAEKTVPKTLNVHDFIKFFETVSHKQSFVLSDDNLHVSPYSTIFSPPPEI